MENILQLKITLNRTKPPIWRRVLLSKETTFFELHHIIQIVMGWENYHLFDFKIQGYRIGEPEEFEDIGFGSSQIIDASTVTLDSVITESKEKFTYEYDFGDTWIHQITVEKFLPQDKNINYPICIDGKLNCPPEDCGGIGGYYHMLDILLDKKHPERKEMITWLGGKYDADSFNIELVNKELSSLENYITGRLEDTNE